MNAVGSSETIPLESSEIEPFTPHSLRNLPAPPVFKLRAAGGREMREYRSILRREGLQHHSQDDFRAEMLRAIKALYTPDEAAKAEARLSTYWEMLNQGIEVDTDEQAAVEDLVTRLCRAWRPLRDMGADNADFQDDAMGIAISMFCVGWSAFDLPYRREEGRTPLALVDQLGDKLQEIEKQAIEDKVEGVFRPGLAYIELANACYRRLNLTEDEEKNSDSPPSSQSTPNGSMTTPSEPTAAASSKASASSRSRRKASPASKAAS